MNIKVSAYAREGERRVIRARPGQAALGQSTGAKPETGAVPTKPFDPVVAAVAEGIGGAVAGRASQQVLNAQRQAIDADPQVDGLDDPPDLLGLYHRSNALNHCPQAAASARGQAM